MLRAAAEPYARPVAFDEGLAERLRAALAGPDVDERRMFGGYGLLVAGNICVGVIGDDLIVRVGPEGYADALGRPGVREFDFTGRPMRGWVVVPGEDVAEDDVLERWVDESVAFVRTLPAK